MVRPRWAYLQPKIRTPGQRPGARKNASERRRLAGSAAASQIALIVRAAAPNLARIIAGPSQTGTVNATAELGAFEVLLVSRVLPDLDAALGRVLSECAGCYCQG